MKAIEDSLLDNPIWNALSGQQRHLAIEFEHIKFYHPDYCPFGAFDTDEDFSEAMQAYSKLTNGFFIVGEKPRVSPPLQIKNELKCLQMIYENKMDLPVVEDIQELGKDYQEELAALVHLVQPGYFRPKTASMGKYYGIFRDGKLIAASGERIKLGHFIEVSAVVTHPEHTRKGYAAQLVAHTVNGILDQGLIPILHVAAANTGAISLYEKSGFRIRRKISFWLIES